jgi:thiamine-phosphate pyrophosphorylase
VISSKPPLIYVISNGSITSYNFESAAHNLLTLVEAAVRLNIPFVQIREKRLTTKLLFELTLRVTSITKASNTRVLVNDRLDIALAAGADGVHLTSTSVRADVVRSATACGYLIGASVHSPDELVLAGSAGADFAVYAPIFETPGKARTIGLDRFRMAVEMVAPFPVIALGGIDETNYQSVIDAGAAGFASIRFLNNIENLEKLSLEFGL